MIQMSKKNMQKIGKFSSKGYTMVELLVGLVLTLFISGIALAYMVSSSRVFNAQTTDALSQENARFAMELLAQNVRLGGLSPDNFFKDRLDGVFNGNVCSSDESGTATGDSTKCTTDNLATGSDRFAIDYMAIGDITGCNGETLEVSSDRKRVVNVFWTADLDNDKVRSLYCQTLQVEDDPTSGLSGSIIGDTSGGRVPVAAMPLIDGIERIQVLYGVDDGETDSAGNVTYDGRIDQYKSYTELVNGVTNPTTVSERVKAIRIAMLVSSGSLLAADKTTERKEARAYDLFGQTANTEDGVFRQVYSTTIMLPNAE